MFMCISCGRKHRTLFDECECGCKPDYEGFVEHIQEWERLGLPYDLSDLIRLAKKYGTPIPLESGNNVQR
jgi:hypothetical protein